MDKEFIGRNALLKDVNESVIFSTRNGRSAEMRGAQKVVNRILEAPTVDVSEVKHGKWVYVRWCGFRCSECGNYSDSKPYKGNEKYCPECGAKMDGDIKNTDHFTDVGKIDIEITDFHIGNVSKMVLPWFSADNKSLLEKVLFFHKMEYPSEMDMELIVIIEGSMQPTILFYDGISFYSEEANGDICFHKVTHWMPLPAPPKKGDVE